MKSKLLKSALFLTTLSLLALSNEAQSRNLSGGIVEPVSTFREPQKIITQNDTLTVKRPSLALSAVQPKPLNSKQADSEPTGRIVLFLWLEGEIIGVYVMEDNGEDYVVLFD